MPDPNRRIQKWDTKFNTERIKATLDEMRPTMLQHVTEVFTSQALMESQVKQVCDSSAVATIMYPFYLCFGREIWSLQRREMSGDSLAKETQTLVSKWVSRGLTLAVLGDIRSQVFNVPAPVAP